MKFDERFSNVSVNIGNGNLEETGLNVWFELYEILEKFSILMRINIPENEKDNDYQKEMLRIRLDGRQLFDRHYTNFIVKFVMDSMLDKLDFEPKLPMPKVNILPHF